MKNSSHDFDLDLTWEELDFSLENIKFREQLKQLFIMSATERENTIVPLFDDDLDLINAAMGEKPYTKDKFGHGGKQ